MRALAITGIDTAAMIARASEILREIGAIAGGVSMGILGPDQYDAEMDFDIGRRYDVMGLGTACPTVFDEDHRSLGTTRLLREGVHQVQAQIDVPLLLENVPSWPQPWPCSSSPRTPAASSRPT